MDPKWEISKNEKLTTEIPNFSDSVFNLFVERPIRMDTLPSSGHLVSLKI